MNPSNLSKYFLLFVAALYTLVFTGCKTGDKLVLQPNKQAEITVLGFDAEKGIIEYANVGDELFVSGKVAMHKCIILKDDFSTNEFPLLASKLQLSINASALIPSFETGDKYLYAAKKGNFLCHWVGNGDYGYCGISIDKKTNIKNWFIYADNLKTLWEMPIDASYVSGISLKSIPIENDAATAYKKIIFDGFYNNLFHFTLIEKVGTSLEKKEFKFNPSGGLTTTVSFKGLLLKIHVVDNLGLKYEWLNPEDGIKDENDSLGFQGA
jgi:hypothetical protein